MEKRTGLWLLIAEIAALIALDQLLKHTLFSFPVLPWLGIELATNTGAGFSLFTGETAVLALVTVAFLAFLAYLFVRERVFCTPLQYAYGLVAAGALSNLFDRLVMGHVVDYIRVGSFPIFNLADSALVIGVVWIIVDAFFRK